MGDIDPRVYEQDIASQQKDIDELQAEVTALSGALKYLDTKALIDMADEYECGSNCENVGPMNMETGVRDCRLDHQGVGCRFVIANEMREFAELVGKSQPEALKGIEDAG